MKERGKYLITGGVVVLAFVAAIILYLNFLARPWTRDAQVCANIVGIAPQIYGPIIQIPVKDNQPVKKGDLLFEIDPSIFQDAVNRNAATLKQDQANTLKAKQNVDRLGPLYKTSAVSQEDFQNAQDEYAAAVATQASTAAQLATAKLNLGYTKVYAPVDGYLTNVNTSPGTYVAVGTQLLALVDASSFWIAANFEETDLQYIHVGDKAKITLMGHPTQSFEGTVQSVAWGIFQKNGSTVNLLPSVAQTIDWVRLPNRFPVRIEVDGKPPVPLRIGQTASVAIEGK